MEKIRDQEIIGLILENKSLSISEIQKKISEKLSIPTLNRELARLKKRGLINEIGKGPQLKYIVNLRNLATVPIDPDQFFKIELDERVILERFNIEVFDKFKDIEVFSESELSNLEKLDNQFHSKTALLSETQFKKEFERLMIELSWKSSQIEGNTYDLLDTEQLLKYNFVSSLHTEDEAKMLINHKNAIEYTYQNRDLYENITVGKIIDIHTLLTKDLGIIKNLRQRIVRITGTKYLPPDNEFIIQEALEKFCELINTKDNVFEKAILSILLISYIQPFEDGNMRTARLVGNAILMNENACPLSYRRISPAEYKKAVLLFYELNNISAFKQIFINQFEFAVNTYF